MPSSVRFAVCCMLLLAPSCDRRVPLGDGGRDEATPPSDLFFPVTPLKDVDVLFVIDNSDAMWEVQKAISRDFLGFVDGLRSPSLNNGIPNVHIGVITTDLGAGSYSVGNCKAGGDGGKLQAKPRFPGCTPPSEPFISHVDGVTNVNSSTTDPLTQVKEAFQCIAQLGSGGCGFEHHLESARRALDPTLNVNPGFVRKDALLAVVFFTDEDDCSAEKPQLFDPADDNTLGPLTSFRCFQFGIQCDENQPPPVPGPQTNCTPAHDWLYKVDSYVQFFSGLKPPGHVILFAVAGPTDTVTVRMDAHNWTVMPTCTSTKGRADPAIRLRAVVDGVRATGNRGYFNEGDSGPIDVCSTDYGPAMRKLARVIRDALGR